MKVGWISCLGLVACQSSTPRPAPVTTHPVATVSTGEPGFQPPEAIPIATHRECHAFPAGPPKPRGKHTTFEFDPIELYPIRQGPLISQRPPSRPPLTALDLRAPFSRRGESIRNCWKWASARGAKPTSFDVELTIDPFSRTQGVVVKGADARDDELVACVRDALTPMQWLDYLQPRSSRVTATLAFVLVDQPAWTTKPTRPIAPAAMNEPALGSVCTPVFDDTRIDEVRLPGPLTVNDWDDSRVSRSHHPQLRITCAVPVRSTTAREVRVSVESNRGELQRCYADAVERTPGLSGNVVVTALFGPNRGAPQVHTEGAGDSPLHACITAAIDSLWLDPAPTSDQEFQVNLTFTLAASPDPSMDVDAALARWTAQVRRPHPPIDGCRARLGIVQAMMLAAPWIDDARVRGSVADLVRCTATLNTVDARTCIDEADPTLASYAGLQYPNRTTAERLEILLPLAPLLSWGPTLRWRYAEHLLLTPRSAEAKRVLDQLSSDPAIGSEVSKSLADLTKPIDIRDDCPF